MSYNYQEIERKWQEKWEKDETYKVKRDSKKKKFYALVEFPYPSGEGLHVGHPRSYTAMDVIARKCRMEGYNVLYPIGWDAFGLPAENYAIKTGIHPAIATQKNIANFKRQLKSLGFSFDWSREINTSDPEYYKWTQWMFLQFFKHGLAYKTKMAINWCLHCKIGLANEEVVNGVCERCGGPVEKRDKEQWMLRITQYAQRLIDDLDKVDYLPQVKQQQINWIGRSEGATIEFPISNFQFPIEIFTTRPDTIFGATYLVLAPEHPLVGDIVTKEQQAAVEAYIKEARGKADLERSAEGKEKTGVFTGSYVVHPISGEEMPVWVADYVLPQYGTGAIMAVPAHDERDFEFAKKYSLEIRPVILPPEEREWVGEKIELPEKFASAVYVGPGFLVNSQKFSGLESEEAKQRITDYLEKNKIGKEQVNYHLRDWVFSRQRYWGEPIPLVQCDKCGWVPVPDGQLPVELPSVKKYEPTDTGESPLAVITDWVNTKCPKCGGPAKRETDTMPNWAGSSWYFLRYCDPHNEKEFASKKEIEYWMASTRLTLPFMEGKLGGVDWYNGGMEHTTLHLLYSRFWYKFLYDIGVIPKKCGSEPYKKRTSHGLILGEGGEKMSKSRGNVVNPDEMVEKYGADAFRVYEMFMGPFDQAIPWDTKGLVGCQRFLEKVWQLGSKTSKTGKTSKTSALERLLHKTIKKVTEDVEVMKFNTAIAALMTFVNEMSKSNQLQATSYKFLVQLLAPFAPHLTEELWCALGNKESVHLTKWPQYDKNLVRDEEIDFPVQINGKLRDTLRLPVDISEDGARTAALQSEKIKKWLEGKEIKKVIFVKGKLINIVL